MAETDHHIQHVIDQVDDLILKQRALDETPFGVTIADMQADDEPLIYVNEGFEAITGYAEDEILGRNCRFLQGEETSPEPVRAMREAIENERSTQVELRNYRKDGTEFWNEVTLSPLRGESGEVTHYVGVQQNVTQRKEYEQTLEDQRDDLGVLNEMVRHDIRNDLQVALASLELLQARETDQEQVGTALESLRQAIELTNTARDVGEVILEEGSDHELVDVGRVVEQELAECQSTAPEATLTVDGTLPRVQVRANDLLRSVFRNLLTNAVDHNDADEPNVVVAATTTDDEVVVTVSDNGSGVPEADRSFLFERGWTGAASGGTGTGLYIARRLVEDYGGTLSLAAPTEATPGQDLGGATFVVRLPLADAEADG